MKFVVIKRQAKTDLWKNHPTVWHDSYEDAENEAMRLAGIAVDTYFDIFKLVKVAEAYGHIEVLARKTRKE